MSGSLAQRVAKGAAFMVAARLAARLIGVLSTLILARLLMPEDFGIIALAAAAFTLADMALATGYALLLVRRETVDRDVYDTAWTMNLIRCVLLAAITVATAPLQAWAVGEPRIEAVLMVVAATTLLDGFTSIGLMRQQRELRFGPAFQLQIMQRLLAFALTVALAIVLGNYWALVLGNLAAKMVTVPYSYLLAPHRPRLCLTHWREFLSFSKWLFALNLCSATDLISPNLLLGALQGVGATGRYAVAHQLGAAPVSEIAAPIRQPLYAGYANVQGEPERLRRHFLESLALVAAVIVPLSVGIALTAPEIERIALGRNWAGTAPLIALCALFALVDYIALFPHSILTIRDRLGQMVVTYAATLLLRLPFVVLGIWWDGATGMAAALLATSLGNALVWHRLGGRELGYSLAMAGAAVARPLLAALLMSAVVLALRSALPPASGELGEALLRLPLLALAGAATHVGAAFALWRLAGRPHGAETRAIEMAQAALRRIRPARR
jgi:O-antigen/teichoic acid export membrane protein